MVKEYADVYGKEVADFLAKEATEMNDTSLQKKILLPPSFLKEKLTQATLEKCQHKWNIRDTGYFQFITKIF